MIITIKSRGSQWSKQLETSMLQLMPFTVLDDDKVRMLMWAPVFVARPVFRCEWLEQ